MQCVHIEPRSNEVSFNTQGIFSFVRYYRKKYLWKEEDLWAWEYWRKNTEPWKDEVLCESERKNTLLSLKFPKKYQIPVHPVHTVQSYRFRLLFLVWLSAEKGWEFTHRFSERIAGFLRTNERMNDSLKKTSDSLIRSFDFSEMNKWANEQMSDERMNEFY